MSLLYIISERASGKCEICGNSQQLEIYPVPPKEGITEEEVVVLCEVCKTSIEEENYTESNHWRCLAESIWSPVPAVQVLSFRILKALNLPWAQDVLSSVYLDDALIVWANTTEEIVLHLDVHGNILKSGDTITLIQDLNVKGANFTAKRGTAVRRIRLVADNPDQIEGKIDGQHIVILTKYVKKS
jgi:protein PhnA